jgi:hypothetical protein
MSLNTLKDSLRKFYSKNWHSSLIRILAALTCPGGIINRMKHGQFIIRGRRGKSHKDFLLQSTQTIQQSPQKDILGKAVNDLDNNGVCQISEYFTKEYCEKLIEKYDMENFCHQHDSSQKDGYSYDIMPFSHELKEGWLNDGLLAVLGAHLRCKFYARNYPAYFYTNPKSEEEHGFANNWHIDHSTLIQIAILLKDLPRNASRMQAIAGTHKLPLVTEYLNKTDVSENNSDEIIDLCGKAGSIYIFNGNTMHRLAREKNEPRLMLKFEFTAGSNILLDHHRIAHCQSEISLSDLDLNEYQKIITSGIFPNLPPKGYQMTEDDQLSPMRYLSI